MPVVEIAQLTFSQKLHLMEALWDDLSKQEDQPESPPWYEDVLKDRKMALAAGKARVFDWTAAKERIRKNVR